MWLKFLIMGHYTYIKKIESGILMLTEGNIKYCTGRLNNKTALLLLNKSLYPNSQQEECGKNML